MKFRLVALVLIALASEPRISHAQEDVKAKPTTPSKKVLVELFTSQGCNSCPPANEFLAQLEGLGYGADQIVPVAFHVDYFNTPWVDPFSKPEYSRREQAYNSALKRKDLYFTPMMMVDGRTPMLGTNRAEAFKAIKKGLAEKPGVSIKLAVSGKDADQAAKLDIAALSGDIAGRSLMVGLVVTEGPMTTYVTSGENGGSGLVEPFVVRSFAYKQTKLEASGREDFKFPLNLPAAALPRFCRVAAFVQDWDNGKVYQAESIPLVAKIKPTAKR